jgi:hypothetical protein
MKSTHHYILNMLRVTPEMGLGSITDRLREHHAITLPQSHVKWMLDQMVQRGEIGTLDRRLGTKDTYPGYYVAPESRLESDLAKARKRRDKAIVELDRSEQALKRLIAKQGAIDLAQSRADLQAAWVRGVDARSGLGVGS